MSSVEVIEQLGRYGVWLEQHEGLELRPTRDLEGSVDASAEFDIEMPLRNPDAEILAADSEPDFEMLATARRAPLLVLAVVIGLVGMLGAGWVAGRSGSEAATVLAEDPAGALFMFPDIASGYTLENGQVEGRDPAGMPIEILVLGSRTGQTVRDLVTVISSADEPAVLESWTDIETESGIAKYSVSPRMGTTATRFTDNLWLTVRSNSKDSDQAVAILNDVTLTGAGRIEIAPEQASRLIDRAVFDHDSEVASTYANVATDEPSLDPVVVETVTAASPLIPVGSLGGEISETTVQGLPAWLATRNDGDSAWTGLAWSFSPNRIVAVSGIDAEEVRAVAESLRQVPEADWRTRTGAPAE